MSRLLDVASAPGVTLSWGTKNVMIRMSCPALKPPISVVWLPLASTSPPDWIAKQPSFGSGGVFFGATIYNFEPTLDAKLQKTLEQWASSFAGDDFAENASSERGTSIVWAMEYAAAAANIECLLDRLARIRKELREL